MHKANIYTKLHIKIKISQNLTFGRRNKKHMHVTPHFRTNSHYSDFLFYQAENYRRPCDESFLQINANGNLEPRPYICLVL